MKLQHETTPSIATGIWYAIAAFSLWGILPIYWKTLKHVPALQILAHRFIWSFVFVAFLIAFLGQWNNLKAVVAQRKKLLAATACSVLICANWGIFIWAVNADHIVDASLGYYINPLFSVCLGMLVLRERLNFWQLLALCIAAVGVVIFACQYGQIPWIALSLATTFGLYGLVKKMAGIDAVIGLAIETMILTPVALGYLFWLQQKGLGAFGHSSPGITLLLAGAGIVTAIPLLGFAKATQQVPLSVIGFIQYLNPTMTLLLGLFLYHEPFTLIQLGGFGLIWLALALFSCSQLNFMQEHQPARFQERTILR
jgi:chloramphenicol-sensitive protein RarD